MKTAICACPDQGPLESLVVMLRSVGYKCYIPHNHLLREVGRVTHSNISSLSISTMVHRWGYEYPFPMPDASPEMMNSCDLYVELKAQNVAEKLYTHWPNLRHKILYYRINGGEPDNCLETECPIVTPNLWYAKDGPWAVNAYTMWPPFHRFNEYYAARGRTKEYEDPVCLVHNLTGWGYSSMQVDMHALGLRIYGKGSPDGLVNHKLVPEMLSKCLAMVHLKQNDAPGYALYEALAAGCPLVVSQRLIERMCMEELFVDGETCLVFEKLIPDHHSEEEVASATKEITGHLERLKDPVENERIGMAGRERLKSIMWNEERDREGLREFMRKMFE